MRINVRQELKTLAGEPLPKTTTDASATRLGDVIVHVLSAAGDYSSDEQVKRFRTALEVETAMRPDGSGEVDLDVKEVAGLIEEISRVHKLPVIAGQAIHMLKSAG